MLASRESQTRGFVQRARQWSGRFGVRDNFRRFTAAAFGREEGLLKRRPTSDYPSTPSSSYGDTPPDSPKSDRSTSTGSSSVFDDNDTEGEEGRAVTVRARGVTPITGVLEVTRVAPPPQCHDATCESPAARAGGARDAASCTLTPFASPMHMRRIRQSKERQWRETKEDAALSI